MANNYDARLDRLEQRFGVAPRSTRLLMVHRRDDGSAVVQAGGSEFISESGESTDDLLSRVKRHLGIEHQQLLLVID